MNPYIGIYNKNMNYLMNYLIGTALLHILPQHIPATVEYAEPTVGNKSKSILQ